MIINLFSIFDPYTSQYFYFNWNILVIITLFFIYNYWLIPSRNQYLFYKLRKFICDECKNNLIKNNNKFILLIYLLFLFIIISNLLGLYPYIFTRTSHILISLSLALRFWLTFIIFGWIKFTNHIFSHLVPLGTPINLAIFIVFIERIRLIIRPITLSVRLTANIIAGHLLLSLLRNLRENSILIIIPNSILIIILLCLEYAVAIIQRYVFITLVSLYLNEIN